MNPSNRSLSYRLFILSLSVLGTLAIAFGFIDHYATKGVEFVSRDTIMQAQADRDVKPDVVMIDIDEASIQTIGPWPWDRSALAGLIQRLGDQFGAKITVLDVVLPSARDAAGDKALLALANDRKLVLAQVFDFVERDTPNNSGVAAGADATLNSTGTASTPNINENDRQSAIPATGLVGNHEGLRNAPCVGNIGFIPDPDGKLRRLIQTTEWQGKTYPSLSLATLKCLGMNTLASEPIQTLKYDVDPQAWTVIPAHLILNQPAQTAQQMTELKAFIENRIVIVGSSALGLSDRVATPLSSSISGMFVHAQSLTELLRPASQASSVLSLTWTAVVQVLLVIAFGLAVIRSQKLAWLVTATLVIGLLWVWFLSHQISQGNQVPLTAALWGFLGIGLFLIPYEWSQARAQSRATAKILARYVAKPVLKDLLKQQNFDPLKPRSAQITVLVADMASYSQTVAEQPLDGAATITKEFLEAITEPVWSLRGTLDRYTGDGLIAFWGAPIPIQNHAELAVKAAAQMHARIEALNERNRARGLPSVQARIGIASGSALVGDFGTDLRANYTAVGTCINMASRLEAAAKTLGVSTLISEVTAGAVTQSPLTPFGEHEIRGLGRITLFTLSVPPASKGSMESTAQ